MTKSPTPIFAGPTPAPSTESITEYDARARRSGRAFDGWLSGLIRTRSADRRRTAAEREGGGRRLKYPSIDT